MIVADVLVGASPFSMIEEYHSGMYIISRKIHVTYCISTVKQGLTEVGRSAIHCLISLLFVDSSFHSDDVLCSLQGRLHSIPKCCQHTTQRQLSYQRGRSASTGVLSQNLWQHQSFRPNHMVYSIASVRWNSTAGQAAQVSICRKLKMIEKMERC